MQTIKLEQILTNFKIEGTIREIVPLGCGLINDTFKVTTAEPDSYDYVLQRVNHHVFTNVELLQHNIEAVTTHIRQKLTARGETDIDRKVLQFVPTHSGKTFCMTAEGEYWRVSVFIPRTQGFDTVTPANAYDAGKAFGDFESSLVDLQEPLGETIPDFHNMELRMSQLREAVGTDKAGRLEEVRQMVEKIEEASGRMCQAEAMYREGLLPKRICHCDSKVSNVLFDEAGGVLCVIDLDTVMPSFVFSDYGDFLRTAANATEEDDPRTDQVVLRWDIIESFTRGYIEATQQFLTPTERDMLPFAMSLFPFMQCVRFLADYINGDTYYKTKYATHNLDRAKNQFRLFELTVEGESRLKDFINKL